MSAWICDLHATVNFGDCPLCDDELIDDSANEFTPSCRSCGRILRVGESAWADDLKVIESSGVKLVTRYTCDQCATLSERPGGDDV